MAGELEITPRQHRALKRLRSALDVAEVCGALGRVAEFADRGGTVSDIRDAVEAALRSAAAPNPLLPEPKP